MAGVVGKLREKGVLSNTYIFFTSDNGWHDGEHRIPAKKARPYEEDVRMPLLVRGPGVAAGHQANKWSSTPTTCPHSRTLHAPHRARVTPRTTVMFPMDAPLGPCSRGNASAWRSAVLLEAHHTPEGGTPPASSGIRTSGTKYVEYAGGKRELYFLRHDPYELMNKYPAAKPSARLVSRLHALRTCAGVGCREAENGP